jgi:uncharacterized membrane protein YkvA (DUF1232 family)
MPKPLTFEEANLRAALYIQHHRTLSRLTALALRKSERHYQSLMASWETLQLFIRMIRAWAAGSYRAPDGSILMVTAAVIYFLSPFDLIPDHVPVFGLLDDAAVIAFVAKANLAAISKFRKWEVLYTGICLIPSSWH